ncbi:MAG: hypothetical protein Q4D82_03930 [Neisseria sp.]|nr:hypothetical protein [Neisseria sp.]
MMKKSIWGALALVLAACSSSKVDVPRKYEEEVHGLKEVCLYWPASMAKRTAEMDDVPDAVHKSLKKLGIKSKTVTKSDACRHVLAVSVRPTRNGQLIEKATARVRRVDADSDVKTQVGQVAYARRGSAKEVAENGGVEAQIDGMMKQLFRGEK